MNLLAPLLFKSMPQIILGVNSPSYQVHEQIKLILVARQNNQLNKKQKKLFLKKTKTQNHNEFFF